MRYILLGAVFLLSVGSPSIVFAEDCLAKLSSQQHEVYSSLSPAKQHMLMGEIKTRDGGSADCAFRGGLLDIVANFPPDKRDAALQQLVDKMLVKQP
jgi:hypothetical protein